MKYYYYYALIVLKETPEEKCIVGEPGWQEKREKYIGVYVRATGRAMGLPEAYSKVVAYWMKKKGRRQLKPDDEYLEVTFRRCSPLEAFTLNTSGYDILE